MNTQQYQLIFLGEVLDGFQQHEVQRKLCELFKLDDARLAQMFSGRRVLIKRALQRDQAQRYLQRFASLGARLHLEPQQVTVPPPDVDAPPTPAAASTAAHAAPTSAVSPITIAPTTVAPTTVAPSAPAAPVSPATLASNTAEPTAYVHPPETPPQTSPKTPQAPTLIQPMAAPIAARSPLPASTPAPATSAMPTEAPTMAPRPTRPPEDSGHTPFAPIAGITAWAELSSHSTEPPDYAAPRSAAKLSSPNTPDRAASVLQPSPGYTREPLVDDAPVARFTCPSCGARQSVRSLCAACTVKLAAGAAAPEVDVTEGLRTPPSASSFTPLDTAAEQHPAAAEHGDAPHSTDWGNSSSLDHRHSRSGRHRRKRRRSHSSGRVAAVVISVAALAGVGGAAIAWSNGLFPSMSERSEVAGEAARSTTETRTDSQNNPIAPPEPLRLSPAAQEVLNGEYRQSPAPKAFAASASGPWGWNHNAESLDTARMNALRACNISADRANAPPCEVFQQEAKAVEEPKAKQP